ncbi:MAG: thioredoxin family protein [Aminivibrio sp.]|jgi:small redox-active disulfide protein 2
MKIQILGTGCPKCKKLAEMAEKACVELGLACDIEKITDIAGIVSFGVVSTPGLAVDGKVLLSGALPSYGKVKELISAAAK